MLLRNRVGEPSPDCLAVTNTLATLDKYKREIGNAVEHWEGEEARGRKQKNRSLLGMSTTILGELNKRRVYAKASKRLEFHQNRIAMENARREVLGVLGISMLLRAQWEDIPPVTPDVVGSGGELGTINDIISDKRLNPEKRQYSRVHTPIAVEHALPEGTNEQWYKEGDLWIRQVRPAEPTDYLVNTFLPRMNITPDLSQHETVYPFIATR